jgi:hypothetical protein
MQNMSTGVKTSIRPVAVTPRTPPRWPSWKIQTSAPNVAVRLSRLSTSALIGTTTLPVSMKSSASVTMPTTASAAGR